MPNVYGALKETPSIDALLYLAVLGEEVSTATHSEHAHAPGPNLRAERAAFTDKHTISASTVAFRTRMPPNPGATLMCCVLRIDLRAALRLASSAERTRRCVVREKSAGS